MCSSDLWSQRLRERFMRNMPDVAARIRFLPRMSWPDTLAMMAQSDVVLDTFHFGGGNTTCEALVMGAPVVVLPSPFLRARVSLGIYRHLGITDTVADSPADYVARALRIARDRDHRADLQQRIAGRVDTLFGQKQAIASFANRLEQAYAAA